MASPQEIAALMMQQPEAQEPPMGALLAGARQQLATQPQRLAPQDTREADADAAAMMPETYANPVVRRVVGSLGDLATLPKRAVDAAAEDVQHLGDHSYEPRSIAPAVETAMTMMGGGLGGMPLREGEAVLGAGPIRAATGGRGDPTQTGWIFKDVAHPPMQRGDWRKVTAATNTGDGVMNVELPIRSMNATQNTVNPDFAAPVSANSNAPFVLKKDGQYYVQDGHHRLTAASEAGSETAPVRLVDLDGTTQTDFPLVDRMNAPPPAGETPIQKVIRAYHGSPHDFDAFSMDKIGTGEGAQAYGHGLYFAENEGVAKQYRDQLQWKGANFDDPQVLAQNAMDRHGGDKALAADNLQSSLDSVNKFHRGKPPPAQAAANANTEQAIALLRGNEQITGKPNAPGRMYEVNINADPEHFLDWDKPLAEQSAIADKLPPSFLEAAKQEAYNRAIASTNKSRADQLWAMVKNPLQAPGGFAVEATKKSPEMSGSLRDAGIPGIKYLDQGSRANVDTPEKIRAQLETAKRNMAESNNKEYWQSEIDAHERNLSEALKPQSRNYVVFNDKLIDIARKYGMGSLAALPPATLAALSQQQEPSP